MSCIISPKKICESSNLKDLKMCPLFRNGLVAGEIS